MSNEMMDKQLEFMGLLIRAMEAGHNVSRELNEVADSLRVRMGLYIGKDEKKGSNIKLPEGVKIITSSDMVRDYLTLEVAQQLFSMGNDIGVEFSNPSRAMRISKNNDPSIRFSDLKDIKWFRIEI